MRSSVLVVVPIIGSAFICVAAAMPAPSPDASGAPALAAAARDPIQVESCTLGYSGNPLIATTDKLEIKFTNESKTTADLVRFRIAWAEDNVAYIRDVGTFSPGIEITHKFREAEGRPYSPLFTHLDLRCTVDSAHFTDGSTWPPAGAGPVPSSTP